LVAETSFLSPDGGTDYGAYYQPPEEETEPWEPVAEPWVDPGLGVQQYSEPAGPAFGQPEPDPFGNTWNGETWISPEGYSYDASNDSWFDPVGGGIFQGGQWTDPYADEGWQFPAPDEQEQYWQQPGYGQDFGVQQYDYPAGPAFLPQGADAQLYTDIAQTTENIQDQLQAGSITQEQAAQLWQQAWNEMTGQSGAARQDLSQQMFADYYGENTDSLRQQGIDTGAIRGDIFNTQGAQALGDIGLAALDLYQGMLDIPLASFGNPSNPYVQPQELTLGDRIPYRDELISQLGHIPYIGGVVEPIADFIAPTNLFELGLSALPGVGEIPGALMFLDDAARTAVSLGARNIDEAIPLMRQLLVDERGAVNPEDMARAFNNARAAENPLTQDPNFSRAYHDAIDRGATHEEALVTANRITGQETSGGLTVARQVNVGGQGLPGLKGPERNINDVFGNDATNLPPTSPLGIPTTEATPESFSDFLARSKTDPELAAKVAETNRRLGLGDEPLIQPEDLGRTADSFTDEEWSRVQQAATDARSRIEEISARMGSDIPPGGSARAFEASPNPSIYGTGRFTPETARWNPETGRWQPPPQSNVEASAYNPATGRWEPPAAVRGPGAGLAPGQPSNLRGWEGNPPTGGIPPGGQGPLPPPPGSGGTGDYNPYGYNYGPQLPTAADLKPAKYSIWDWLQVPRGLLSGLEMSGGFTHLGMQGASHPLEWTEAVATGVRAMADPDMARAIDHQFKNTSLHGRLDQKYNAGANKQFTPSARANQDFSPVYMNYVGGAMNQRQEEFASRLINKIGVAGIYPYEIAARGSATMFNAFRSALMDDFIARAIDLKGGAPGNIDILGPKELEAIKRHASFIDASTGWGHMGKLEDISTHLGQILFSPRYLWSQAERASYLIPFRGGFDETWRQAVKTHSMFLATGTGMLATAAALGIGEVQANPNHTDFGKITIDVPGTDAKQTFNIWGPYQPLARMLGQVATGEYSYSGQQKDYFTGEVKDYEGSKSTNPLRAFTGWFLNKQSPQAGILSDILGTKALGIKDKVPEEWQKTIWPEYKDLGWNLNSLMKIATPILVQDIYKAAEKEGLSSALRAGAAGFVGISTNTKTPGDPFLFPQQQSQQDILSDPAKLTAAGIPAPIVDNIRGANFADLGSREKQIVSANLKPEDVAKWEQESRDRLSEYQAAVDAQNKVREDWQPIFQLLDSKLKDGQNDPYIVRQAIKTAEADYRNKLNEVEFPESKNPREQSTIQEWVAAYNSIYEKAKGADGKINWEVVGIAQKDLIATAKDVVSPEFAERLAWNTEQRANPKDPPLIQFYDNMKPVTDQYYSVPKEQQAQWRIDNPKVEGLMVGVGYLGTVHTPQAAEVAKSINGVYPDATIRIQDAAAVANNANYPGAREARDIYFGQVPEAQQFQWLKDHPREDAILVLAGYLSSVHSMEAYNLVQNAR
jgi:hypothetical protein